MKVTGWLLVILSLSAVLTLGAAGTLALWSHDDYPKIQGVVLPNPEPLNRFVLKDHEGNAFSHYQLQGQWSLIVYGYTSCPDFCPTVLRELATLINQLQDSQKEMDLQVLFYAIDPERDADRLATYVNYFHPEIIGLIASESQGHQPFEKGLGMQYLVEDDHPELGYNVAHGSLLYLINPKGELQAIFKPKAPENFSSLQLLKDITSVSDSFIQKESSHRKKIG